MPSIKESALRSRAKRQGYVVHRSRNRGWPLPDDHGEYMIVDDRNIPQLGFRYDATLDDVAEFLSS